MSFVRLFTGPYFSVGSPRLSDYCKSTYDFLPPLMLTPKPASSIHKKPTWPPVTTRSRIQQSYTKMGIYKQLFISFLEMKRVTMHSQWPILQLQVETRLELTMF